MEHHTTNRKTSTAPHTPGPWQLDYNPARTRIEVGSAYAPAGLIATIAERDDQMDGNRSYDTEHANARLISVAPEMLVLLQNALGSLEACEIILRPKTERARLSSDIRDIRALLAKVEAAS